MDAIVFDLDGTLLKFTREYENVLRDTFTETVGHSKQEWIDEYNKLFYENFENINERPYHKSFLQLDIDYPSRVLVDTLQEKEIEMCEVPKNCKKILDRLAKDYKVGVLTNGVVEWQKQKIKNYNMYKYFDDVIVSYETGYHKPNLNVYRYVENEISADSYTMISDDYIDLRGCRIAGWEGFKYNGEDYDEIYGLV